MYFACVVRMLGWQLYCHPRGNSTTVAPTSDEVKTATSGCTWPACCWWPGDGYAESLALGDAIMLRVAEASDNQNVGMNIASVLPAARERLRRAFSFTGDSIMFRTVQLFVCVACVVAVCLTVGVLRADVVYNADNDYPDSEFAHIWHLVARLSDECPGCRQYTIYALQYPRVHRESCVHRELVSYRL